MNTTSMAAKLSTSQRIPIFLPIHVNVRRSRCEHAFRASAREYAESDREDCCKHDDEADSHERRSDEVKRQDR